MNNMTSDFRFWGIIVVMILQGLAVFNIITGAQSDQLVNIISVGIGAVIALSSYDRAANKKVEAAAITAGISARDAKAISLK